MLLITLYPTSQHILTCLLNSRQGRVCHKQCRRLAAICLGAEDSSCIEWRLLVKDLHRKESEPTCIITSPASLLVDGRRRFELQMQYFSGGFYTHQEHPAA